MNKVPYTLSENSLTIFWEGKPYTLREDHPNFETAKQAIFDARYEDLGGLIDIVKSVEDFVEGDIEVREEVVYYKNHRLHGVVVDKLMEMLRAGMKDSAPLTNFITRLQANPSANSVTELYSFMSYKSLPNTPEGKVLGYKGVKDDFYSSTGNADTIVVQGEVNESHQIFNGVGETIEVARRCVDDNRDNHCSYGLHVGSYDYANGWAGESGRLLVVEFDPADAVSVPTDCNFQKLRVSKYKVIEDITDHRKEMNKPVYEANKPIYDDDLDSDESEEYDDEYEDMEDDFYDDYDMDDTEVDENDSNPTPSHAIDSASSDPILNLEIRNYVENKIDRGEPVTINHVNSLKVCRDSNMTCQKTLDLVKSLGIMVELDDDKSVSQLEVFG